MRLLIITLLLLFLPCAAADNVTIEIFQNSNDEYFIQYNGELHACVDDECTFNVSANVTQQDSNVALSTKDIKKIAQYVALEIDMPTGIGSWNKTYFDTTTGTTREYITDNLRAYIANTVVPTLEEINTEKSAKMAAEAKIVELEGKGKDYDNMVQSKDETIDAIKRENDRLEFIAMLALIGFGFVILTCTDAGKEGLNYVGKFRGRNK